MCLLAPVVTPFSSPRTNSRFPLQTSCRFRLFFPHWCSTSLGLWFGFFWANVERLFPLEGVRSKPLSPTPSSGERPSFPPLSRNGGLLGRPGSFFLSRPGFLRNNAPFMFPFPFLLAILKPFDACPPVLRGFCGGVWHFRTQPPFFRVVLGTTVFSFFIFLGTPFFFAWNPLLLVS